MKTNPMIRSLDHKIADLIRRKTEIEGHLEVLKALRVELTGLVRRRKPAPSVKAQEPTSNAA